MLRSCCLAFALILLAAAFGWADDAKGELKKMDGVWQGKSAEMAGKKLPEPALKEIKLEMKDGAYTVGNDHGTVKVDPSKSPKTMDIKGVEGPNKGKTFLCIYELDGDKLKVCYDLSGKSRPKKFETKEKTQLFLV